ncbi:MAG: hypothetical protein KF894_08840 [Labilithrix sp.]|nr:hypothetical protein [Labilithrix sp.]
MGEIVLELPFLGGIDQAARAELVDPAKSFTLLSNVRQDKRGGASKRLGYLPIGRARVHEEERLAGHRLLALGRQLCTIDGAQIDAYSSQAGHFVPRGPVPEADYAFLDVPSIAADYADVVDVAHVSGCLVIAYLVSAGPGLTSYVAAAVLDAATHTVLRGPQVLYDTPDIDRVCLATYDGTCILLVGDGVQHEVSAFVFDATDPHAEWNGLGMVASDYYYNSLVASVLPSAPDRIAFAYSADGADEVKVKTLNASGVMQTRTIAAAATVGIDTIDLSEHGSTLFVCWSEGSDCNAIGLNPTALAGTPLATQATVMTTTQPPDRLQVCSRTSTTGALLATLPDRTTIRSFITASGAISVALAPAAQTIVNAISVGRPFMRAGRCYTAFTTADNFDAERGTLVICEWTPSQGGAKYLRPVVHPVVRGLWKKGGLRCRAAALTPTRLAFGFMVETTGTTDGARVIAIDFASRDRWQSVEHHGSLALAGGVTSIFDGTRAFESGFLAAPSKPTLDASAGGSVTTTSGGRRYVAVYADVDAAGNLHISGVSTPSEPTGNVTDKSITVTTMPLAITARGGEGIGTSALQVLIYATNDGGEAPYHLIGSVPNLPVAPITFVDNFSETVVRSGALLYGSGNLPGAVVAEGQPGGPQDHRAPPGLKYLTSYNGMLVGASGRELWWSAETVYGEAVWHSPVFSLALDEEITGLAASDGALFVLTRSAIFSVSGGPPNDTGTDPGLGMPRKIGVDLGCVDGNSIVVTSSGIFFRSARGIELFRGGSALEYVGEDVQDELAAFPHVTSAVLDTKHGVVRFSLAASLDGNGLASGEGRDVVYDLTLRVWISSDRKHGERADEPSQDASMVFFDGGWRYGWLGRDGAAYVERLASDDEAHFDGDAWVTARAETSWINIAGVLGEQVVEKILHLSTRHTDHTLVRTTEHDYRSTDAQITPFGWEALAELGPRMLIEKELVSSRGQAVRVLLEDGPPTSDAPEQGFDAGSGKGATWVVLSVVGVPHRGPRRTSAAERG